MLKRLACCAGVIFLCAWRCPGGTGGAGALANAKSFAAGFSLDGSALDADLTFLTAETHPFGSPRQAVVAAWLARRTSELGARAFVQEFTSDVPNPAALKAPAPLTRQVTGRNVFAWPDRWNEAVAKKNGGALPCVILFGSHYDTKHVDGMQYVGANDSGSSSVALLQMIGALQKSAPASGSQCGFAFVWFDGEESTLPDWYDGETRFPVKIVDHTWGSRHAAGLVGRAGLLRADAGALAPVKLGALVLMDMVGSPTLRLTHELLSTPGLVELQRRAIADLEMPPEVWSGVALPVEDDHKAFLDLGVPALNIIDFNDVSVWHRDGDVPAGVNPKSIEKAIRIAMFVGAAAAAEPQAIR